MRGRSRWAAPFDEAAVEIYRAEETLQLLHRAGPRVSQKGGDLLGKRGDASGRHPVAQEVQGLHSKLALLTIDHQAGRLKPLENVGDVQEMLLRVGLPMRTSSRWANAG